jgi:beta-lactamase class A
MPRILREFIRSMQPEDCEVEAHQNISSRMVMYNPPLMTKSIALIAGVLACATLVHAQDPVAQGETPPAVHIAGNPAQSELLWQKLEATVHQVNRDLDGTLGVAILDLSSGRTLLQNPDAVFTQASSIKVAVLAELYRQQQSGAGATGKARLSDLYTVSASDLVTDSSIMGGLTPDVTRVTDRDLATFMIAVSDNSATNVLIDRVGMGNVNAMLESLGLSHTRLQRRMMDIKAAQAGRENLSTPRDMMTLFADLYQGKVLNKELTEDFFKVLGTPKESDIPRYIPERVLIANKPGELAGVRNDVGIVFVPQRPFVIVVMTAYLKHERDGNNAIAKIAGAAYDYFDRVGRWSEYGRIVTERNSH